MLNHLNQLSLKAVGKIAIGTLLVLATSKVTVAEMVNSTMIGQLRPNSQPRGNQPPRENLSFELKGSEVRVCRPKPQASDGKECQGVGKGYTFAMRTATDLLNNGNIVNAELLLRQITDRFPKKAEAYYKLGVLLTRKKQIEEAIVQYQKAIEINPNYAKARNELAAVLATKGNLDEAIEQWQQAVSINAEYAEALNNLGIALLEKGQESDRAKAIDTLRKARELFIKQGKTQAANRISQLLEQQGL